MFIPPLSKTTALVLTAASLAAAGGCILRQKEMEFAEAVDVRVDRVAVQSLGLAGATLNVHTRVVNRSDVNFSFKGVDYEIYYQGRLIGSGRDERYRTIHPRGEDDFVFAVQTSYADAVSTFMTLGEDDVCLVKGRVGTISVAGKHALDFAVEARFGRE
jgi:LEA14-like dessication related protein